MKARSRFVPALGLAVLGAASCGSGPAASPTGAAGAGIPGLPSQCPLDASTHLHAHIGPDVSTKVLCGLTVPTVIPLATVDVEDDGSTSWTVSLKGDPTLVLKGSTFQTCQSNSPTLAAALVDTSQAAPGAIVDGVATVSSDSGSFPAGEVDVHVEIVAPAFTVAPLSVDFGDVLPDQLVLATVLASGEYAGAVPFPSAVTTGLFQVDHIAELVTRTTAQVTFVAHDPGDYTDSLIWTAFPGSDPPSDCVTMKSVALHARVIAPDAGAGGAGDAGVDGDASAADAAEAASP
ncbi:MAG TPA: hypothetical protein VHL80_03620 [Polyangia bacterium]|nr:hypothetical protein [Polyangia bacterium]